MVGDFPAPRGAPTVVLYNHLDVQPADARGGRAGAPSLSASCGAADRYFGRGTTDDKGPALAALFGVRAAREAGVPVGVRLLWEMEEEIGSPSLEPILRRLAPRGPPHSVVVSDAAWLDRRRPTSIAGLRGFMGFRLVLDTAEGDAHSGDVGGAARNPLAELMQLSADLHDARTGRVRCPASTTTSCPSPRASAPTSGAPVSRSTTYRRDNHLRRLRDVGSSRSAGADLGAPDVRGPRVVGGYTGPGIKAAVPGHAEVKVSCRLVPRQDPERDRPPRHRVRRARIPDVEVHAEGGALPYEGSSGAGRGRGAGGDVVRLRPDAGLRARRRHHRRRVSMGGSCAAPSRS